MTIGRPGSSTGSPHSLRWFRKAQWSPTSDVVAVVTCLASRDRWSRSTPPRPCWHSSPSARPTPAGCGATSKHLPFRRGGLGAAWARGSYLHVPTRAAAARARGSAPRAGASARPLTSPWCAATPTAPSPTTHSQGASSPAGSPTGCTDVVVGAGFEVVRLESTMRTRPTGCTRSCGAARTLPDTVGPGMRLLVCGLNPSVYSADAGVGSPRPGNRFWPAALAAGPRDPRPRPTPCARAPRRRHDRPGQARDRPRRRAEPRRVPRRARPASSASSTGSAPARSASSASAVTAPRSTARPSRACSPSPFGGVPAYVMPNTSGLNARVPPAELAEHLRAAARLGDDSSLDR